MRRWTSGLLASALLLAGACGDDEAAAPTTTVGATTSSTAEVVGDGSAFCDAMIGIGKIDLGATPADVLAANERLASLIDEAEANTPASAPTDLDALIGDYRAASEAITAAEGDIDAAYAALPPEVVERLAAEDSHGPGYDFLVAHCGLTAS